jgi:hypothetical protein
MTKEGFVQDDKSDAQDDKRLNPALKPLQDDGMDCRGVMRLAMTAIGVKA